MDHDAELDAILEQVETAGLVEQDVDEGRPAMRLTPEGVRVGRQLAMLGGKRVTPQRLGCFFG
jgi:hypothetical protein